MKRRNFLFFPLCAVLLLQSSFVFAWFSKDDAGTCGAQFLKVNAGGRPSGMGGAYSALATDVNAVYWNPGGLASVKNNEAEAMYVKWFEDTSLGYMGFVMPVTGGAVGFGITALSTTDMEKRGLDETLVDKFDAQDIAVGFSYGKNVKNFGVGLGLKAIQTRIDTEKSNLALAIDLGCLKQVSVGNNKLNLSASVQNIGTGIKYINKKDPLPGIIRIGAGYFLLNDKMIASIDLNLPRDNKINANFGFEYRIVTGNLVMPVRVGYSTLNDFETIDGISAGFGIGFVNYNLNFAWVPYGDLGDTMRLSIGGKF